MPTVRPLTPADLPACEWAGPPIHLEYVREALRRSKTGTVDYLAVTDESGPVSIGGVDYNISPGYGTLWQLSTAPDRRSRGFGTMLIGALEDAARQRGLRQVRLTVETDNVRARQLYERLGYTSQGEIEHQSWLTADDLGRIVNHKAECLVMTKDLVG